MTMNITIRQIQAFLQVAALGSFTRAAEKLHTLQPALSQQVRDLEAELGIRLFDRTTRRVELTDGGAEFRNIAAKIIEDLELAARNAQDLAERKRGRVVVAAPPLLAAAIVPRAIAEFGTQYPGLSVRLIDARTDQIVELVRSGQVDCGIGTFHAGEDGIVSTRLARDSLMVFCAAQHPLAGRASVDWRELDGLALVTLTRDSGIRLLVEVGFEAAQIKLVPAYEVAQITTALAMVEAGLGVAVLPTYAFAAARALDIRAAALEPGLGRDISLIARTGRSLAPAVAAFARVLGKYASAALPDTGKTTDAKPQKAARKR
ncbi:MULTISPECIES: LysR family transcriptional regulator [unclassified Bradyrhizobium]|uniref:LysR family transcriptional regulator n=1 Tax=unclassified Bradyrhizobium TaxID=2631580 RepID=UPI00201282F2|nr:MULTISPECIES: LysR family transcriptional regulator [unclassified Bradyrhizobium]